jgi:hypothetical protein
VERVEQGFELGIVEDAGHRDLLIRFPAPLDHGARRSQGFKRLVQSLWRVRASNWRDMVLAPGAPEASSGG